MKNLSRVLAPAFVLATMLALPGAAQAQSLSLTFNTSSGCTSGGNCYNPKNIVAVWVTGPSGFVKTIGRWAGTRRSHLTQWVAAAGSGDTDAVSGATRPNHNNALTLTWNCKNRSNVEIPDGTYTVRIESADSHTASQSHEGTFTFDKGPTSSTQNLSGNGFSNIVMTYTAPAGGGSSSAAPPPSSAAQASSAVQASSTGGASSTVQASSAAQGTSTAVSVGGTSEAASTGGGDNSGDSSSDAAGCTCATPVENQATASLALLGLVLVVSRRNRTRAP